MREQMGGNALESNAEWIQWGKRNPLYAVSTWSGKQKGAANAWTEDEFYKVGESDWQDFECRWKQYGYLPDSCLEIGCGAGRLTRWIAKTFQTVDAVDVSPDQIAIALPNCAGNVTFHVTGGLAIPLADSSVSNCFTAHVFQHLDSPDVLAQYLREIARVMHIGGSIMAHLPLYSLPYEQNRFGRLLRRMVAWKRRADLRRDQKRRARGEPIMRHTPYDADWLIGAMRDAGFSAVEFTGFHVRSNDGFHWFALGRR